MMTRLRVRITAAVVLGCAALGLSACDVATNGSLNSFSISAPGKVASFTFAGTVGKRVSLVVPDAGSLCEGAGYHSVAVTLTKPDGSLATSGFACTALAIDHYRIPAAGTYTVRIDPNSSQTGEGSLAIYTNADTTKAVTPNVLQPFSIATPGQVANFTFAGAVGKRVSAVIPDGGTICAGASYHSITVTLLKPDGTTAASGYACEAMAIDHYRIAVAGTYTLRIDPKDDLIGEGTSTFYVNADTTAPATTNALQPITISTPGQVADITISGTAGQYISAGVPNSGTLCASAAYHNISITLLRPDGTQGATGYGCEPLAIDHYRIPTSGAYTLRIDPAKDLSGSATAAVYANADTTAAITSGVGRGFTIATPGQVADFTFAGTLGQHLTALVPNTGTLCGSASYGAVTMTLFKPDGTQTASGNGCQATAINNQQLPATGTYTLRVDASKDLIGSGTALATIS